LSMPASLPRAFDEGVEISRFKRRLDGPRITEWSPGIATNGGRGIGTASSGSTLMFGQGVQLDKLTKRRFREGNFVKTVPWLRVRPNNSCAASMTAQHE
jgi:hypothetical protein